LADIIGDEHVFYGPENLHVTVRSIEGYREAVPRGDYRVSLYERVLCRALEKLEPVTVEFAGVTASTSSVLLQGWPDASLQDFRNQLYDMLSEIGAISGPELSRSSIRKTCHATLALIGSPLEVPERFVEFIEAHRATYYSRITFRELELVQYRRTSVSSNLGPGRGRVAGHPSVPRLTPHDDSFTDKAASITKVSTRTPVLDGKIAIYDHELRSRFEWLLKPDPDAAASVAHAVRVREGTGRSGARGAGADDYADRGIPLSRWVARRISTAPQP
jgi:hypothetical protein